MLQIRFTLTLGWKSKFGKGDRMVNFPDTHEDVNCQNMETKVNLIGLSWRGGQVWSWVNCPFKWDICRISKYWRSQSFLTCYFWRVVQYWELKLHNTVCYFISNLLRDKSSSCPICALRRSDQSSVSMLPKSFVKSGAIPNRN